MSRDGRPPLRVRRDSKPAAGFGAVRSTFERVVSQMGVSRGLRTLRRLNQEDGFDCPGCAWPDPAHRSHAEFCENGAKAVAHEATTRRLTPEFFTAWSIPRLLTQSDHWLEAQGRLTQPMIKRSGRDGYEPIAWEDAFVRVAEVLNGLSSPDEAIFYTSGRTSNEAAFLYQLFVRQFGTNNLPDCSNMCHESSSTALTEVIGVGKGTVSLEDFERADAIFVIGQNPGTNHPRMLSALEAARKGGCRIVSVNPLRERGLVRFSDPKSPLGLLGRSTAISDLYLQIRVGGDVALLLGVMKEVLLAEERHPGSVLDWDFIREKTEGFEEFRAALDAVAWGELVEQSGVSRAAMREAAEINTGAERVIACWAMGVTQHKHAVANVQEIVNLLLLRGNIGKPGAGPCPVRGHSNVQGDRTMGICEKPSAGFLDRLASEFDFQPPRDHGLDTVAAIRAMADGRASVFLGLGGNFAVATPDSRYTADALRRCRLTAQISTKLNRSHLVVGDEAIILPCLGRTERDEQAAGPQFVSVENSMSVVHRSQGHLPPASASLRSEPAIVAGLARAALGEANPVPWEELAADYDRIRERIARVVPGFENFNRRIREPGSFVLPSGARTRRFETPSQRAHFTVHALPTIRLATDQYLLMTIRSHDQYNTTIYGFDDRYRGISGDRRVLLLHPDDMRRDGLEPQQQVDLTSHFGGEKRTVCGFRVVPYEVPRRCAATYFPEANPLVPIGSFADGSRTPTYKSIVISVAPSVESD